MQVNLPAAALPWRRSTRCDNGHCIEVAFVDEAVMIRDSKAPDGPLLHFSLEEWRAFAAGIQAGEFGPAE
jgi:hypothetical protein